MAIEAIKVAIEAMVIYCAAYGAERLFSLVNSYFMYQEAEDSNR